MLPVLGAEESRRIVGEKKLVGDRVDVGRFGASGAERGGVHRGNQGGSDNVGADQIHRQRRQAEQQEQNHRDHGDHLAAYSFSITPHENSVFSPN